MAAMKKMMAMRSCVGGQLRNCPSLRPTAHSRAVMRNYMYLRNCACVTAQQVD